MNHDRKLLTAAFVSLFVLLAVGTITFKYVEGWSAIDSFYFSGMTMLTVGYGDITPHTSTGKIAAIIFAFIAVGIALYSVNLIARLAFRQNLESTEWLLKKKPTSESSKGPSSNQSATEQDRQYK